MFYSFSPRFWLLLLVGSPNASINSSFLRLNHEWRETPSIEGMTNIFDAKAKKLPSKLKPGEYQVWTK